MKNHSALKLAFSKAVLLFAAAVVVLATPLGVGFLQASAGRAVVQNPGPETFEVVSIRPADPNPVARGGRGGGGDGGGGLLAPCSGGAQLTAGRININNSTLFRVITNEGLVRFSASAIPIRTLINIFQGQEARFVVDKTGMKGLYDITPVTMNVGPFDVTPGALSVWPEIMQQLGLKLEPARGPLETLIIDRLERPSAN